VRQLSFNPCVSVCVRSLYTQGAQPGRKAAADIRPGGYLEGGDRTQPILVGSRPAARPPGHTGGFFLPPGTANDAGCLRPMVVLVHVSHDGAPQLGPHCSREAWVRDL
jgi:hypothetical protein